MRDVQIAARVERSRRAVDPDVAAGIRNEPPSRRVEQDRHGLRHPADRALEVDRQVLSCDADAADRLEESAERHGHERVAARADPLEVQVAADLAEIEQLASGGRR